MATLQIGAQFSLHRSTVIGVLTGLALILVGTVLSLSGVEEAFHRCTGAVGVTALWGKVFMMANDDPGKLRWELGLERGTLGLALTTLLVYFPVAFTFS